MKLHHLWQDRLWISYREGGTLVRCTKFKTFWKFIRSSPYDYAPSEGLQQYQAKCFAGIRIGLTCYGYDFIIGRRWRKWNLCPLRAWRTATPIWRIP